MPTPLRIAICEAGELAPERDAGSRAMIDALEGFHRLGHEVRLVVEAHGSFLERVREFRPDVLIVSRPGLFVRVAEPLSTLGAPLVYWAHDLHFVRVGLQASFDAAADERAAAVLRFIERRCFERADLVVLPTTEEVAAAALEFPDARAIAIDYFAMPMQADRTAPPASRTLVFVGGPRHAPNRDGVRWFAAEVLPSVRDAIPAAELLVVGEWDRDAGPLRSQPGIRFTGALPDAEVDALLQRAWVGVAPLRFGAGMKRKTLHYLSHGLPVVGSGFAVEGLTDGAGRTPGVQVAASDPGDWLAAIRALEDEAGWMLRSRAGAAFVRHRFSADSFDAGLSRVLEAVH